MQFFSFPLPRLSSTANTLLFLPVHSSSIHFDLLLSTSIYFNLKLRRPSGKVGAAWERKGVRMRLLILSLKSFCR
ncbi:hypothetical protein RchiOBHm_Chr7g0208681 [Rosa chinensis]|uniref:Uncharacterized protein n=1 Tax=Rosa chinensis TaxID=74649 RepID=A0A2P6P9S1_ROSCH|nr:hypothetical protein RchiOBHm_Chr7g0208681 [Rosa chinensis]